MRKILLVALSLFLISAWTAQAQYGVKVSYEPAIYTESMNFPKIIPSCAFSVFVY
ncbi:MAG: hypothetical protein J6U70_01960 [Bacteroidales bacterium]|nr:hypothetical protein [Bacteroidales bacterium]